MADNRMTSRQALQNWDAYVDNIRRETPVEAGLSQSDMAKKRRHLETHIFEWITYFFPNYAKYPFARFQKEAIQRLTDNPEWYEVLSWSRELAKSTVVMFTVLYLVLTGRKKNVLLASATQDSAKRLLAPYRANLEGNRRLTAFYGEQKNIGSWTEDEFIPKNGAAFRAIGAGNAPRGSRNEAVRPDVLLVDDFDTDEGCRNPDTIQKNWEWYEQAFYATRSISEPTLIVWCGNIIAKDCCVVRAAQRADHHDVVNIRDRDGHSTWPEKNTEEHIDMTLSKISTASAQKEYFNNPVSEGEVFKDITWGKVPPLAVFPYLVNYGDPAPGEGKGKGASTKTCILLGWFRDRLYIIKAKVGNGLNAEFIRWYFDHERFVAGKTAVYHYIENNSLQDPFFRQVFMPLVAKERKRQKIQLSIRPDEQRKTDKATRIEANLEPLNREGRLVFNEEEKDSPDMQRLADQFSLFTLRLKFPADGPDCVEGGYRIIRNRQVSARPVLVLGKQHNSKRL